MHKIIPVFIFFLLASVVNAQEVLFSVEGNSAFADEFKYVYKKNAFNNEKAFTKPDIDEYLELYKNFKLKIYEASQLGLDTLSELITEFESYREQLRKPYLTDDKVKENLIQEAYERYKQEVNASHILITLTAKALPKDTLEAWNKIVDLRNRAVQGEDFNKLATEYSNDPSAKVNGGNLGYFTSMKMVYPFESAAFNTDVGEISMPVRTQFGYHIIKVLDKVPSRGKVKVSHIILRNNQDSTANLRNRIFEIFDRLQTGLPWEEAVSLFSEDESTKNKGGLIDRAFTPDQLPPNFSEAAFSLKFKGEISDPVLTQYGWHIIRLEERISIESFEEMEPVIRRRISSDQRSEIEKTVMITKLKKENGYFENSAFFNSIKTNDTTRLTQLRDKTLFTISENPYKVEDYLKYLEGKNVSVSSESLINEYVNESIIKYEEDHLAEKYPEYKYLVNEYWEGIQLFRLMDDLVWKKAAEDSLGLVNYYKSNKSKYKWDKRLVAKIYKTGDETVKSNLREEIESGKTDADLKQMYASALALSIDSGAFEIDSYEILTKIEWEAGVQEINDGNIYYLAKVFEVLEPEVKKIDECMGLVISDFQDELDKALISKLRKKYSLKVNKKVLKKVYEELVN